MGEAVIECRRVTKRFYHYEHRTTTLQEFVYRRLAGKPAHVRSPSFHLEGLDLVVQQGETVALIGANGSGKSTALRLIAGIYPPTAGTVVTRGHLVAVIELGATFQPELTGVENIELYGAALGMRRQEVRASTGGILDFAGVDELADVPLKYYSSGMRSRLAFSIALGTRPDTLLLDEVLAVGDAAFSARCHERLASFTAAGGTLVVVSHDFESVGRLCARAVWLDQGRARLDGPVEAVVTAYLRSVEAGA